VSCPACGSDNRPGAKFCSECGAALATACPSCGSPVEANAKFCPECGARLTPATPVAAGEPAAFAAAPAAAPTGIAERRLVTVLFADLVGFTTLAEGRDAEQVRELLSRYFEVASEIVARYGGTVEKFIGDAVMAVWGTPVAHEDDAERAVRAGLDLLDAVHALGREVGLGLDARAGALTGEAAVTLGARNQGMVAGDLVNTASRLQSVAPPGTVLVGEGTQRAAAGAIAFEPAGEQLLKGKTAPVAAWRALRVVAMVGGANRAEALEPPFVGRETEFRLLRELFHATGRERRARLLSLTGQAGIGKSRLAWEFHKYIDGITETVYWHQGRCPSYGEGVTFWALGEMIRKRAGLAETDDETTTRGAVATALEEYVHDLEERRFIEPCLLALLGVGEAPAGGRERLFAGWRLFFERISDDATVALVFEDLQWADDGMLDFIEHLLEWSRSYPILILTLARPELLERRPTWGGGRASSSLALDPLGDDEMRALLAGLVPGLPESAVRTVLARASGIPLYAVETVRMLVSDGRLEPADDGTYRPTGDLGALEVPGSLQALIAARLDVLDPVDRALLQDAAVLGQTFGVPALASVSGETVASLEPRLRDLARRELLELDTDPRSPERGQYGFVQALIREVAYGTLVKRDRRAKHLSAARYFESLEDGELAGALATHYLAAYDAQPEGPEGQAVGGQARIALRAAAERAAELGSPLQALAYLEQSLAIVGDDAEAAALLDRAAAMAEQAGRHGEAEGLYRRAIERHRATGDGLAATRSIAALGSALLWAGRLDAAMAAVEPEVLALGPEESTPEGAELLATLARVYALQADEARAVATADRALAIAERLRLTPLVLEALTTKAVANAQVGRPIEAILLTEGVTRVATERGYVQTAMRARNNLATALLADDPAAAAGHAWGGAETARRYGAGGMLVNFLTVASEASLRTGEWARAAAGLRELDLPDLDPGDARIVASDGLTLDIVSGAAGRAELDAFRATWPDEAFTAPQDRFFADGPAIWLGLAEGDDRHAIEGAFDLSRVDVFYGPIAIGWAIRAALWLHDRGSLDAAIAELDRLIRTGRWIGAMRLTAEAGRSALTARTAEAATQYREAVEQWRDLGCRFDLGLCLLDVVRALGPRSPEGAAAAAEARQVLGELGAKPFLRRLDGFLEAATEAGATESVASADRRSASRVTAE
jgi:class 3 adenylate cyclase/tetratricopeptide (TPR) repeat protein